MEKYFIKKSTCEIRCHGIMKNVLNEGITLTDCEPTEVAEYESLEAAKEELKQYKSSARYNIGWTHPYFLVTEYYVEIMTCEYDEDGDLIVDQCDIAEISENDFKHDAEAWDGKEEEDAE